ncbi:DUF29 domain-containing protein [Crocosphaera sp. XPORK-15E]|uniref:DUF29 domain-containing protein n=1 Tax=Crocosphaera sp. XPORK-15E TaxID=3110247 RepID=UPI002B20EACE|nr:DUF29 domain-containing protein [Crocosphaera sp. XPORK-15E]MEA5533047.1 DUF29 domain-containing protein [Crocosphaera sp. XPORK-15E]
MTNYNSDLTIWAKNTAQLLRERRWDAIDWDHLIEEVEDLGKSERSAIASQMERIMIHLLKWQYQLQRLTDSWLDSINDGRSQIRRKLEDSPSLVNYPRQILEKEYIRARREASRQTRLEISIFPESCPYIIEQVINDWFPDDSVD